MLHATRSSVPYPSNPRLSQQSIAQPSNQESTHIYPQQAYQQQSHTMPIVTTTHTQTQNATDNSPNTTTQFDSPTPGTSQSYIALPVKSASNILLPTALVKIKDRYGNAQIARALLDSCSQHCLMSQEFSRKLKLKESSTFLSVQGIGSCQSVSTKTILAEVCSRSPKISGFQDTMQFFVLPKLALHLPSTSFKPSLMTLPDSSLLADPYFYESKRIDVIIGAEYFTDLLKDERGRATKNGPSLQNTVFGWIVSGRVVESPQNASHTLVCSTSNYRNRLYDPRGWKHFGLRAPTPLKNRCAKRFSMNPWSEMKRNVLSVPYPRKSQFCVSQKDSYDCVRYDKSEGMNSVEFKKILCMS